MKGNNVNKERGHKIKHDTKTFFKNNMLMCVFLTAICIVFCIVLYRVKWGIDNMNGNRNPYMYLDEYVEKEIPNNVGMMKDENINFVQIQKNFLDVFQFSDSMSDYFQNQVSVFIAENGKLSFPRDKEQETVSDEIIFNEIEDYMGGHGKSMCSYLHDLIDTYPSITCLSHKVDGKINGIMISQDFYSDCNFKLCILDSKDFFDKLQYASIFKQITETDNVSFINDKLVLFKYAYRQRIFEQTGEYEEKYTYTAYFESDDKVYLSFFTSNYTKLNSSISSLEKMSSMSQEDCRELFCQIVKEFINELE